MSKPEEKKPEQISRRSYLQLAAGTIAGLVVGGALGYVAKPTVTAPPEVVTKTVTETVTGTVTATTAPPAKLPYEGVTLKLVTQTGPFIAGPQYEHSPAWTAQSGGKIEVIEVPYADLYSKIMTDVTTGTKAYDILVAPSWATPDFSPYVVDLTDKDPSQLVDWGEILYTKNTLWGGHRYNVPLDGDHHMMYYNKLALENPDHQAKFKAKYGYDIPAKNGLIETITWEEYHDIAEFFNGWDWVGDGRKHYGVLECCARATQTPWWFWDKTIAYNTQPGGPDEYLGELYFDPETMDPLVNEAGFIKGLTNFVSTTKLGPPGMLSFSVGEVRSSMVNGDGALAIDWPDIGPMSVDKTLSKVIGQVGFGQVPGATTVWDRQNKKWIDATWGTKKDHAGKPINTVPILNFGGWAGFVVKTAANTDAAFDYLKFMNSPEISILDVVRGSTGFNPYRKSHFTNTDAWLTQGWALGDVKSYLDVIQRNISDPRAMPDLKIPGSAKYTEVIDIYTTKAISGEVTPASACKSIYDEWQKITDDFGRDKQKAAYKAMMGIA
jgi:multiple sugar transport system substrate-binding protein